MATDLGSSAVSMSEGTKRFPSPAFLCHTQPHTNAAITAISLPVVFTKALMVVATTPVPPQSALSPRSNLFSRARAILN